MSATGLYTEPPALTAVKAVVVSSPVNDAQGVFVTIPSWGGESPFGPCVFAQKGATLPTPGTACLVVFDEDRVPWVVMWAGQTT